jgi:hypothetical protein
MLRPGIPAAIQQRFGFIYRLLDNKYYMDWFNEHVLARAARAPARPLARRRCRLHRQHPDRRLGAHDRRHLGADPPSAERLPVLVCAGDDRRRDRPDDLAALAVPRRVADASVAHRPPCIERKRQHGLAEPGHLAADPRGRRPARRRSRRAGDRSALGALLASLVSFVVTLPLVTAFDKGTAAMQFQEKAPWIERFNVNYHLGVDGLSVWFVLLTAFITVIVVISAWQVITERVNQYMGAFLILSGCWSACSARSTGCCSTCSSRRR